jgi:hypothetical protein
MKSAFFCLLGFYAATLVSQPAAQSPPTPKPRKQTPAELADRGPILTGNLLDPTCRRFCGGAPIPPQFVVSTVITDAHGAVRWVLPGKLKAVGYDGDYPGGFYFHFDNGFWSGPYQLQSIPH